MQPERKDKQQDAKGKVQSDIQCKFWEFGEQRIFLIQRFQFSCCKYD